ncbi:MAG TPA: DegT/DnrJ/EryC1/StrS family aminotransferase [Gemmatimonadaceae bacterium]|nr:DegT/DnrJ/EryC1/StrS family aminotransferase [Gemmatimonadaceae bacterium]
MSEKPTLPAIPQANPGAGYLAERAEIDAAAARVFRSGWYILGPEVEAFEREFASFVGCAHAVGVSNGTDAIELALRGCGVERGDIVFTVSHTAVATVSAIERIGGIPVLVDIDPATFTMSPERLEHAIRWVKGNSGLAGSRARAVIPVHLYGQPADMTAILSIARRAGLQVLEDCAQAHGASLNGRGAGSWGDVASFSFYPTKNLAALGDGGAVTGNDTAMMRRVAALRQYGWEERYISSFPGFNTRLDELQAAILRARLSRLHRNNERRREIAATYDALLADSAVQRPIRAPGVVHAFHQYVIRCADRDALKDALLRSGIGTAIHYPVPIHLQPAYRDRIATGGALDATEAAAGEILSLPMYPELTDQQVQTVGRAVANWQGVAGTGG